MFGNYQLMENAWIHLFLHKQFVFITLGKIHYKMILIGIFKCQS